MFSAKIDFLYQAIEYNMKFIYDTAENFNKRYPSKTDTFKIHKQKVGNFLRGFNLSYKISKND